jgi:4-amino-4-deoxy-L-arabinose transferase-like glycosyltransferase
MTNFENMLSVIKKYWREICVAILAAGFFAACYFFIGFVQKDDFVKWASPDETANYVFAKLYGQTGQLEIYEKYNPYVSEIMQPRSFRSDGGLLKPVSFLGIILIYGTIVKLSSSQVLPYLTPFFAALAIFFYYLLIKKVFTARLALLSVFLLISFPVFFYYSVRSMFHNVLFVSFLIIGLYFIVLAATRPQIRNAFFSWRFWKMDWLNLFLAALGGSFVGAALITRTSEALWVVPVLAILWLFNFKKVGIIKLIVFLAFTCLPFVPVMSWNQALYGGFFRSGYSEMNRSITTISSASADLTKTIAGGNLSFTIEPLKKIKNNIFYFGFRPDKAWQAFTNYFNKMFPWLFWPAFLGLILFFSRVWKWKKRYWAYILAYFTAATILVLYYGSWDFHDNPNPNEITIGNSYTRYWLPIYLGAMPLAAFFLSRLSWALFAPEKENIEVEAGSRHWYDFFLPAWPRRNFLIGATQAIFIILIAYFSFNFLWFGSQEGLVYSDANNAVLKQEYDQVLKLTESSAVIITRYHDKIFFPERKVIVGLLTDDNMNVLYKRLVELLPVYYFNFTFPEKDFQYLNDSKLKTVGLKLEKIKKVDDVFSLYKLENRPPEIATTTPEILKKPVNNLKLIKKYKQIVH